MTENSHSRPVENCIRGRDSMANESRIEQRQPNGKFLRFCKRALIVCGILSIIVSLVFAFLAFVFLKNCTGCESVARTSEVLRMFSGSLFVIGIILLIVRACQLGIQPDGEEFGAMDDAYTVVSVIPEEALVKSPAVPFTPSAAYHHTPRVSQWHWLNEQGKATGYDVKYEYPSSKTDELQQRTDYNEQDPPPSYEQALQMAAAGMTVTVTE